MKRTTLTGLATLALALGAFAQGIIGVDDGTTPYGVAITPYGVAITPGNYYSGTFGMEVWELNASAVPNGIDAQAWGEGDAYGAMVAAGFKLEATYVNQTMTDGTFSLGQLTLRDATPGGASVVVGLAVWNTSAPSWAAMLASANQYTGAGVLAFVTATEAVPAYGPPLPGPSLSVGWTTAGRDLVIGVPEPSALALGGLGGAPLWLLGRRLRN